MANNRVYTESVVTLNNQEATARIDELKKKAVELRQEMMRLAQEKGINSKEFKAVQKELIATQKAQNDLGKSMKDFEKIVNNLNGSSLNELQKAYRTLQQRMRAAKPDSKEFKQYSETLKQVRARMRELEDQGRQTQKMFGGFFSKIGWAGLVASAIAAFKKFGQDMINQTQLIGDKWKFETAGWKSAYGSFIADLSSGKGWNELIQRMKDAYKNGKDVAKMLDEIFERNNSALLQESELNLEAEKQKKIYMDATKSARERIEAAEEYDRIQQEIAANRKVVAQEELDAYKLQLQTRTEMSDAELDAFIRDYNNNKELIDQAIEYQAEYKRLQGEITKFRLFPGSKKSMEEIKAASETFDAFKASADETVVHWAGIIDKYNLGNDEMVKNYVQARQKMTDADTNYERATQWSSRRAANLRKQLSQETQSAINKAYQDDIAASDARFKELTNQAKQAYSDGEISEQEYQDRLTEIQRKSLQDRMAIAEKHKQSTIEFQSQLLDLAVSERKQLEKQMEQLEKEAQKALDEALADLDKDLDEYIDKIFTEQAEHIEKLLDKANEIRREMNPADALKEDAEEEIKTLKEVYDSGLISQEDFEKKKLEIVKRYAKEILAAQVEPYQKGVENSQKYLEQVSSFIENLQEAASTNLEAQMQAELTAAGDNAEKREEIEAKYEQKQLDLKKKYADVDMGIQIAKAIAAGALAVMQGYAELGPIGGAVMAALVAATTAAQVALIVAQRNAIKNTSLDSSGSGSSTTGQRIVTSGYSKGGYTDSASNDYQEVGIVHANEWVAPAAMVRANPVMFASLESMRKSGNYQSGVSGYAEGGTVGNSDTAITTPGRIDNELLQRVYDIMAKLEASLPLKAYTVLSEFNAKQELDATIKSIAGKG